MQRLHEREEGGERLGTIDIGRIVTELAEDLRERRTAEPTAYCSRR